MANLAPGRTPQLLEYPHVAGVPPAPPPYSMEKLPGYENATFDNAVAPPPTAPDSTEPPPLRTVTANLPQFTEEEVREAVTCFASDNCCYSTSAAIEMAIMDITMNNVFRYTLETFGEKRESAWRYVPYTGQLIDGPSNGPPPTPWNVTLTPRQNFKNAAVKTEVPHTAFVKPCHVCVGNGRVPCQNCRGTGRTNSESSSLPNRCYSCSGRGQEECRTCRGKGQVKGFVELTVTWTNHWSEYITQNTAMPEELIRDATGQIVLQENLPKVIPVTDAGDIITTASNTLISKHNRSFPNERILRQRQVLRSVPIAQCIYSWKDKTGNFFLYGYEHKVYFPTYPQQCCWGCNIL